MKTLADKKIESCPRLFACPRITMTPMIRALLRCSAEEAMKNICASCTDKKGTAERQRELVGSKR